MSQAGQIGIVVSVWVAMNTLNCSIPTCERGGEKEKMAEVSVTERLCMIESVMSVLDEDKVGDDRLDAFADAVELYREWLRLKEQE